jgi:hypothetical protein
LLQEAWTDAREWASQETGIEVIFPDECPEAFRFPLTAAVPLIVRLYLTEAISQLYAPQQLARESLSPQTQSV